MLYAPKSARIFEWIAVMVPSFLAPMRMLAIWSRPWWVPAIDSERVSVHLTGRWTWPATQTATSSSA